MLLFKKMRVLGKIQMVFCGFSDPSINDLVGLSVVPLLDNIGKNSFLIVLAVFEQKLALDLPPLLKLLPVDDDPRTDLPVPHPHRVSLPVRINRHLNIGNLLLGFQNTHTRCLCLPQKLRSLKFHLSKNSIVPSRILL